VGAAVLVPSLGLLYTLVLRGRLDAAASDEPAASVPGPVVVPAARRAASVPGTRLAWAFAGVSLVAGVGLLVFASPAWAIAIGVLALLACAVTVFALTAAPEDGA
jgi:hypothetical protein